MTVVPLLVLLSLALAFGGVVFFLLSVRNRDHEHADRLALLPLEDDDAAPRSAAAVDHEATDSHD